MSDKEQIQVLYQTNLELADINKKYLDIITKLIDMEATNERKQ